MLRLVHCADRLGCSETLTRENQQPERNDLLPKAPDTLLPIHGSIYNQLDKSRYTNGNKDDQMVEMT
jgi:hypothetical protein